MASGEEKTEQPTGRRLKEARREGRLPQSMEVPQALTLIVAVVLLPGLLGRLHHTLVNGWRQALMAADPSDPAPALHELSALTVDAVALLLPLVAGIMIAAVLSRAMLGGIRFNVHQIHPKPKKLNPLPGLKNMVSKRQIGQLARLTLKMGALALLAVALWGRLTAAVFLGPSTLEAFVAGIGNAISALLMAVLALSVVAGAVDGVVSVRKYRKDLRMTKQEVREDHKQTESNPQVKQEIRARQRKMSRMRMMAEVVRADVVLTNPTHFAVALRYEPGSPAPKVVAKGADHMAKRIRELAAESGVPVRENKPLARALYSSVEIGEVIPVHLYQAVAEVLAVVYRAARHRGTAARS